MARFNQWTQLLKASATSCRHDEKSDGVKQERYLLLDTAMGSENSGDHVIMDACGCIADQIFGIIVRCPMWQRTIIPKSLKCILNT